MQKNKNEEETLDEHDQDITFVAIERLDNPVRLQKIYLIFKSERSS